MPLRRLAQHNRYSLPPDPSRGHQPLQNVWTLANITACKPKPQAFFCNSSIMNGSELCTMQIPRSGSISNGESDCHLGLLHFP
ncbi:hypothetical protein EV2_007791 [Malus domestica]|uniref:Uncharacterized protein n=1 Tax=Malus domestica TaxID=3750 RepID=A0A498IP79_MALDO|nr:hypothetical protein DVH24_003531 [Malus domestica]